MLSFEEALQRFYLKLSAAAARFGLVGAPPVTHWDPNYSCKLMDRVLRVWITNQH